jgi:hypothetical protein
MSLGCPLIPQRLDLLHSQGISQGSLNAFFLGDLTPLSVKYLGVIVDSRLTWREHVNVKVRKAHCVLWACRRAYGVTWGLRPRVAHWLYVSIIRPSNTVASLVRWRGCQTASAKKKLCRIQLAFLGITGAMCTTPTMLWKHLFASPTGVSGT